MANLAGVSLDETIPRPSLSGTPIILSIGTRANLVPVQVLILYTDTVANLYIAAEVVVLCLSHSVIVDPGYGSVSLEHGRSRGTGTETKSKVLDSAAE